MKIVSIIGARPQFIKVAMVNRAFKDQVKHIMIHSGQHYDWKMSQIFFDQLGINEPDHNLDVGSGTHAYQTAEGMKRLEPVLEQESPDCILVYGDTNTTLAGAITASKLGIKLGHVEAGLRSYNRSMPEEINRVITDHCSNILFCPTKKSISNLKTEGITNNVHFTGDIMYDTLKYHINRSNKESEILNENNLEPYNYILLTLHRPQNVDDPKKLSNIIKALSQVKFQIIWPAHPRVKKGLDNICKTKSLPQNITIIEPVGYLDMLLLESKAIRIITDSGGIQKEAYLLKRPCITIRPDTEWTETVTSGWNVLVDNNSDKIIKAANNFTPNGEQEQFYGNGEAGTIIAEILMDKL